MLTTGCAEFTITRQKQWAESAAKKAKQQLLDYINEASDKYPSDALLGLDPDEQDSCMTRRIAGFLCRCERLAS